MFSKNPSVTWLVRFPVGFPYALGLLLLQLHLRQDTGRWWEDKIIKHLKLSHHVCIDWKKRAEIHHSEWMVQPQWRWIMRPLFQCGVNCLRSTQFNQAEISGAFGGGTYSNDIISRPHKSLNCLDILCQPIYAARISSKTRTHVSSICVYNVHTNLKSDLSWGHFWSRLAPLNPKQIYWVSKLANKNHLGPRVIHSDTPQIETKLRRMSTPRTSESTNQLMMQSSSRRGACWNRMLETQQSQCIWDLDVMRIRTRYSAA